MKQIIILLLILVCYVTAINAQSFPQNWTMLGTLDYGQTTGSIAYKNPPQYRAYRFSGKKDDQIDVWVRSENPNGAEVWLLDDQFKILAHNDDGDNTSNAHIKLTLPIPDNIIYYIVFRDHFYQNATFTVSLKQSFAQNLFSIIDVNQLKENYIIVSARDGIGRTIQFQVGDLLTPSNARINDMIKKSLNLLKPGSKVIADFNSATVSPQRDNINKYKIIKPTFSNQCCSIVDIFYNFRNTDTIITKKDTANGSIYFSLPHDLSANLSLHVEYPIFEKYYNNKRYAILKPLNKQEISKNIVYSYELGFMPNKQANSFRVDTIVETNQYQITRGLPVNGNDFITNCCKGILYFNIQDNAKGSFNIYSLPPSNNLLLSIDSINSLAEFYYTFSADNQDRQAFFNVDISKVKLKYIPIFKGSYTRIKAGALNITTSSPWTLYDSSKINTVYTSTVPKKVEFPVGIYQLEMNGTSQQIQIKDGQTLQIGDSSSAPQTQKLNSGTQPWEIKMDPTIKGIGGQITMQVPKGLSFHTHIKFFEAGDSKKIVASWFGNNSAKLLPGLYDAVVDDEYTIKNVPVELGKQTRLKMGVFKVTGYGTIEIENSNHQKFSAGGPFSKVLPEGTYYLNGNKKVPIVIKDGELTEL